MSQPTSSLWFVFTAGTYLGPHTHTPSHLSGSHRLIRTHTHLHLVWRCSMCSILHVLYDARDAERPDKAQQIGQVTESAAEQDGTTKRSVHGEPDWRGSIRVLRCLCGVRDDGGKEDEFKFENYRRNQPNTALNQVRASSCSPFDPRKRLWAVGSWWGLSWRWAACRSSSALWAFYGLQWWEDSSTSMSPKTCQEFVPFNLLSSRAAVTSDIHFEVWLLHDVKRWVWILELGTFLLFQMILIVSVSVLKFRNLP